MGIGNSTARYRGGRRVVWSRYTRRVCIDWHTLARLRRGKGRERKGGGRGGRVSLSRASLGNARHEIFKIQMATRIRSRALRLIRNFLNSNAFKLAPPLPPSPLPFPTFNYAHFLSLVEDHSLLYVFFFFFTFLSIDGNSNFTSGKLIISFRSRTIEFLSGYSSCWKFLTLRTRIVRLNEASVYLFWRNFSMMFIYNM